MDAEVSSWDSSDSSIVEVENGLVTGIAVGTATITATMIVSGRSYSDSMEVTVTE